MDNFNGLGVFFDTYANSRVRHTYPYIMAMIGDGKTSYNHDFDGNTQEAGGCIAEFRNKSRPTTIRITYILSKKNFKLEYKTADDINYNHCFSIEVELPEFSYFGFSAATGGVTASHDILGFRTWEITSVFNY
jgi:mannose-binding lectin 2